MLFRSRHLGIRVVLACSFARIHRANLVNFGILPLLLKQKDYTCLQLGSSVEIDTSQLQPGQDLTVRCGTNYFVVRNDLSPYELDVIRAGGLLNTVRK